MEYVDGGTLIDWNAAGTEISYSNQENKLKTIETRKRGTSLEVGSSRMLSQRNPIMSDTEPFKDRKRFPVNRILEPSDKNPITLVTSWTSMLRSCQ